MSPASAVSGWYFSHPQSRYFGTGKIGRDQLESLADVLRGLVLETPINLWTKAWWQMLPELLKTGRIGKRMLWLSRTQQQDLPGMFSCSAGD